MSYDRFISAKRNPSLGGYNGTRDEWYLAYRLARIRKNKGLEVDAAANGVSWKAQLVIYNERNRLLLSQLKTVERYRALKFTDKLLDELLDH